MTTWLEGHLSQALRDDIRRAGGPISIAGLAARWNVSRQRIAQYATEPGFPAPIPVEGTDLKVYLAVECERWFADRFDN